MTRGVLLLSVLALLLVACQATTKLYVKQGGAGTGCNSTVPCTIDQAFKSAPATGTIIELMNMVTISTTITVPNAITFQGNTSACGIDCEAGAGSKCMDVTGPGLTLDTLTITGTASLIWQDYNGNASYTVNNVYVHDLIGGVISLYQGNPPAFSTINVTNSVFKGCSDHNGNFNSELFNVMNGNISISNSTFYNITGGTEQGVVAHAGTSGHIIVTGSSFDTCINIGSTSTLYSALGNVYVTSSSFSNCMTNTGTTVSGGGGGAIGATQGDVYLTNVYFYNSSSIGGIVSNPGGVVAVGTGNIYGTNVTVNQAWSDTYAGAFYVPYGNVVITDASFNGCTANYGYGGAIYISQGALVATNVVFENNYASSQGGAFEIGNFLTIPSNITNAVFYNNSAGDGGCVFLMYSYTYFNNASFTLCTDLYSDGGAAVYLIDDGNVTFNDCSFQNINSTNGVIKAEGTGYFYFDGCVFNNNPFRSTPSQIYNHFGATYISNTAFYYPALLIIQATGDIIMTNVTGMHGYHPFQAAIQNGGGVTSISHSSFYNFTTYYDAALTTLPTDGGLIYAGGPGTDNIYMYIDHSNFTNIQVVGSPGYGGVILINTNNLDIFNVSNSRFVNSSANGGGFFQLSGTGLGNTINLTNNYFSNGMSNGGDGTIFCGGGLIELTAGDFDILVTGNTLVDVFAQAPNSGAASNNPGALIQASSSSNTIMFTNNVVNTAYTYYIGQNLATTTYLVNVTRNNLEWCIYSDMFYGPSSSWFLSGNTFNVISAPCLYSNYTNCLKGNTACAFNQTSQLFYGTGSPISPPSVPAPAPAPHVPTSSPAPAPAPHAPAPAPQSQTPAPAPISQSPAPQSQTPAPQSQTPAPQAQSPAPQAQTPAPQAQQPQSSQPTQQPQAAQPPQAVQPPQGSQQPQSQPLPPAQQPQMPPLPPGQQPQLPPAQQPHSQVTPSAASALALPSLLFCVLLGLLYLIF